ncbi:MAG TPA: type II CAAX endopeptidase family protein [Bryobacteraceae bacterium]|jgi:membrane protease YdiL (CAAX protease family)|nr:type II CAAX endopeptidase family protein [Bryobacteraceae bacterium]
MMPATEPRESPFWTYEDLGLFVGSLIPVFLLALGMVRVIPFPKGAVGAMVYQSLIYTLLLGVLYVVVAWRYARPFWASLGWTTFRLPFLCAAAGPLLAVSTSTLGILLKAPPIPSPIEDLISDRRSLFIMMLFLTVFGPVFEELVFRGFLFPLLARSVGPWPGILLAATPFALVHGSQYHWSWQHLTVVGLAGVVFGFARYKTESTAAATLVHTGYNATLFIAFLVQKSLELDNSRNL